MLSVGGKGVVVVYFGGSPQADTIAAWIDDMFTDFGTT